MMSNSSIVIICGNSDFFSAVKDYATNELHKDFTEEAIELEAKAFSDSIIGVDTPYTDSLMLDVIGRLAKSTRPLVITHIAPSSTLRENIQFKAKQTHANITWIIVGTGTNKETIDIVETFGGTVTNRASDIFVHNEVNN